MSIARKPEFSYFKKTGELECGRQLAGGARQMRAKLVAVSGNVADAELAQSLVGSSDLYGAIGHRFVPGNFHHRQT